MTQTIIKDWSEEKTTAFGNSLITFQHKLNETGLFTDDALEALLDKHPSEELDVCTMDGADHPLYPNRFRTGDFRDTPAKDLIAAAKAGRIWINVRRAMNIHPEYKSILDKMYTELADYTGTKVMNPKGGVLISSPVSQTPYHFDKTEVILWHVRGKKRVYVYPQTQKFISDESFEKVILDRIHDDLPYSAEFDAEATILDLKDGQAVSWPLNSPHRVDNGGFCVSVTAEYSTRESVMKNAAMMANATLRTRLGLDPSYETDSKSARYVKSVFGRVLNKISLTPDNTDKDMVTFKIDASKPDFIVDVEPYERQF